LANVVAAATSVDTGVIRVDICGAVLHVAPDCSPERVAALAAALRKAL
jgi:transposase